MLKENCKLDCIIRVTALSKETILALRNKDLYIIHREKRILEESA